MTVFILCAGNQERFGGFNQLKQLLEIEGEPLLHRAVRQISKFTKDITIVAHNGKLKLPGCNFLVPEKRKTTCHTILSTQSMWNEKNIILLGDVYYTDHAIDTIFNCDLDFQLFTDTGDFFGISFKKNYIPVFEGYLKQTLDKWAKYNLWTCPILELYRTMGINDYLCTKIADRTQDFDRYYEYQDFLKGKTKNRLFK